MLNDWINYGQIYNDISDYAQLELFPAQTPRFSCQFPFAGSTNDTSLFIFPNL